MDFIGGVIIGGVIGFFAAAFCAAAADKDDKDE